MIRATDPDLYREGDKPFGQKIIYAAPPNYSSIARVFPVHGKHVAFSYGDRVYVPAGLPLSHEIMVHESVHGNRQDIYGVEKWWTEYIKDPVFRLEEEFDGHKAELQALLEKAKNRHERRAAEAVVSKKLASPLYGFNIARLTMRKYLRKGTLDA